MKTIKTVATLVTEFCSRPGLSPSTLRSYESTVLPLLRDAGWMPLSLFSRSDAQQVLDTLSHLSLSTHHRYQAIYCAIFNFGLEQGDLTVNPFSRLKPRKADRTRGEHGSDDVLQYLSPEQLQAMYRAVADSPRLHLLCTLLHQTGARVSELLALTLAEVNPTEQKFQVLGKGNKRRWCFFDPHAAQLLERYLNRYRHPGPTTLFTACQPKTGQVGPLSYRTAHWEWRKAIARSRTLAGVRLHDLRHTFATERVGLMSLEELRALMGHERIETTLRYQKVTSRRAELVAKQALQQLAPQPEGIAP